MTFRSNHPAKKLCVACKESMPADATICPHCHTSQEPEKTSWGNTGLKWVAGITAVVGLITGLSGVVGPLKGWWTVDRESKTFLSTALRQEEVGDYSAAFDTLTEILKNKPTSVAANQARLDVTMLWVEDIWAPIHTSDELAQKMRPIFDRMTPVLEAGLGAAKDYRAADVAAHLGWLNLLKARILGEQGKIEELVEHALQMDPGNVYANAMMGDLVLEDNGPLEKAKANFATALKTGKAKDFIRGCQLQSMIYNDAPGVRAELIRTVNEMREDGETLGDASRSRVHSYYSTTIGEDKDLRDVVSALPPDKAWATYQWVSPRETDDAFNAQEARFSRRILTKSQEKKRKHWRFIANW